MVKFRDCRVQWFSHVFIDRLAEVEMHVEHPHHMSASLSLVFHSLPPFNSATFMMGWTPSETLQSGESGEFGKWFGCLKSHAISLPTKWRLCLTWISEAYKPGSSRLVTACISLTPTWNWKHLNQKPVLYYWLRSILRPENLAWSYIPCMQ